METFNTKGYNPYDDDGPTGFRRPPKDTACVCDYFAALMTIEDNGKFMHQEMSELLTDPDTFFQIETVTELVLASIRDCLDDADEKTVQGRVFLLGTSGFANVYQAKVSVGGFTAEHKAVDAPTALWGAAFKAVEAWGDSHYRKG